MDDSPSKALLDQLRRDAREAAGQRTVTAQAEANSLRAEAKARLAGHRIAALAERTSTHTAALERLRSDTRARTSREWLAARAEALARIFAAAHTALAARAGRPDFQAAVTAGARDAIAYLPPMNAVARCSANLAPTVHAALSARTKDESAITVTEDASVTTGVVLETADHSMAIDATFAQRLARERPRLAIELVRQLERMAT